MRGFDSCYPCIYKFSSDLNLPINYYSFPRRNKLVTRYSIGAVIFIGKANQALSSRSNLRQINWLRARRSSDSCAVQKISVRSGITARRTYLKLKRFQRFNRNLFSKLTFAVSNKVISFLPSSKITLASKVSSCWAAIPFLPIANKLPINLIFVSTSSTWHSLAKLANRHSTVKASANFLVSDHIGRGFIEFLAFTSGSRSLVQFYPFLARGNISPYRISFYKTWISRLEFYQKRLGHRFFMEETIHIMHLAMNMHDSKLFTTWLGSLIKRISFWKTRSIFRYLLYLFNNFFISELSSICCKGIKLRLKGKISAAGNSRKRVVNLKFGKVSYSTLHIKCLRSNIIVTTFTGAMNLRVELFY